jgi:cytochrome c-type biogenesis protein
MTDGAALGSVTAFLAGIVSFLSPCVLPLVPAYVSFIAGQPLSRESRRLDAAERLSALALSAFFVLGFSAVFMVLGAGATAAGRLLQQYRYEANIVGGAIVILFGLLMIGMTTRIPWFYRDLRFHPHLRGGRPVPAFVLGAAFGFGWTPCIGPVLGAILTVGAVQSTASAGVGLLAAYAAGLGVPFLLTALFTRELAGRLRLLRRLGSVLQIAAGVILIVMGVAMITGQLTVFALWLLETFPVLGRIG